MHLLTRSFRASTLLVCLVLTAVTLLPYWQVRNHDFVNHDDDLYVSENRLVLEGLSPEGIREVFKEPLLGFWHPLTLLSHMLDCQLFGPDPGSHHLVSLLLHTVNTLLLFLVLKGMTGALLQSAFVAALFAVHPLHVESVAWIAGRKDVLSTLFWFLTMLAYGRYVRRPGLQGYALVLLSFLLGLMAKPMLVTLPFVLLLLDYWPLGRMEQARWSRSLFLEKIPLVILSAAASVLTLWAEKEARAIMPLDLVPLFVRAANALTSYVTYIQKMFFPSALAVIYPHPGPQPLWKPALCALILLLISSWVVQVRSRCPYLLTGWLWFLGTLVPVIGLVQVGSHAMADRYTYVPIIGLWIMIAWGVPQILHSYRYSKQVLGVAGALTLVSLTVVTWFQVGYWKNSVSLFAHALRCTRDNIKAHNNLGVALAIRGRIKEAEEHYRKALLIAPNSVDARNNLGNALADQGRHEEAMIQFKRALELNPRYAKAHNNLGISLVHQGRVGEAVEHYQKALRIDPKLVHAMNNLGRAFHRLGELDRAVEQYRKALALSPNLSIVCKNLGTSLFQKGLLVEAEESFKRAIRLNPGEAAAYNDLATLYAATRRYKDAIKTRSQALSIEPDNGAAHYRIAVEYYMSKDYTKAAAHCERAIALGYAGVESTFIESLRPFRRAGP